MTKCLFGDYVRGTFARASRGIVPVAALALLCYCGPSALAGSTPIIPDFNPANFPNSLTIDNPFSPLVPGTEFVYRGQITDPETNEQGTEEERDTVTNETRQLAGVTARVVRSQVFDDGVLAEDTLDFFAQDSAGNVWYMGEETKAFERNDEGDIINTDTTGSWKAGANGAKPGFALPHDPPVGFAYFQENAPADQAVDQAEVVSRTDTVTVPVGTFTNVLKTLESTSLEPGVLENKLYASGVGLVQIQDLDDEGNPINVLPLVSVTTATPIPLPAALWPGLAGLVTVGLARWHSLPRRSIAG
jgi:hypothetical protein